MESESLLDLPANSSSYCEQSEGENVETTSNKRGVKGKFIIKWLLLKQ